MLTLIEAETTNKLKSSQTSFKMCIYIPQKSDHCSCIELTYPTFSSHNLWGIVCSAVQRPSVTQRSLKSVNVLVSTSRSKTSSWTRDRCLNKERCNSPRRRHINPSGCLWTSFLWSIEQAISWHKGNFQLFFKSSKMPATIDRPDSLTSKLSESIRFETMGTQEPWGWE